MLKGPGVTVFVHQDGLYYQFRKEQENNDERVKRLHPGFSTNDQGQEAIVGREETRSVFVHQLHMQLMGASAKPQAVGLKRPPYFENYFNVPSRPQGISNVRSFEHILIKEIYPNIDWALSIEGGRLKYDFIIRPGGQISDIKMRYGGADEIKILEDGSLTVKTSLGEINEAAPFTFQQNGTGRTTVESRYSLLGEETIGFSVGNYRKNRPLVIDPSIVWAS